MSRKKALRLPSDSESYYEREGFVMYAIIVTGGKQYKVEKGDQIYIEKLDAAEGDEVVFDQVLFIGDGKKNKVGTPTVKGATVTASVLKNGKAKKVTILKYKPKKDSRKKQGHRQPYTKVEITAIAATAKKAAAPAEESAE